MKLVPGNLYKMFVKDPVWMDEKDEHIVLPRAYKDIDGIRWLLDSESHIQVGCMQPVMYIASAQYEAIQCAVILVGDKLVMIVATELRPYDMN